MKPKVLVVSDDPAAGKIRGEVRSLCHVTVSSTSTGGFDRVLSETTVNVVVADCKFPMLDGITLAYTLRRAPYHGTFVSWGPIRDIMYVNQVETWDCLVIERSHNELVTTLRALLDPNASRTLREVRYQCGEDSFFLAFGDGKTYLLPRKAIPDDDGSSLLGSPKIIHGGSAFEVRLTSGRVYQVPWDFVLYQQEPKYPYQGEREPEGNHREVIGARIRRERESRGWSLADLSAKTDIHVPNLSRLETGKHTPSLPTLERIAEAFGVPVVKLLAP